MWSLMKKNCSSNSWYNIEGKGSILYSLIIHKFSNLKKSRKEIYKQRNCLIGRSIMKVHSVTNFSSLRITLLKFKILLKILKIWKKKQWKWKLRTILRALKFWIKLINKSTINSFHHLQRINFIKRQRTKRKFNSFSKKLKKTKPVKH